VYFIRRQLRLSELSDANCQSYSRTQRTSGTDRNLFSVSYATPDKLWAVGDWGAVVYSEDGGKTWTDRSLSDDIVLTAVHWADEKHGMIVGEFGTVRYTQDGGQTFESPKTGTDKTFFARR
jgi:photosystem II stability/assembly factor-like uncharacterized protein